MKHIMKFNEKFWFKSKQKSELKPNNEYKKNSDILIEVDPYEKSQFDQNKYKVYICKDNKDYYYIGDIRHFPDGDCISYLNLSRIAKKEPELACVNRLHSLSEDEYNIVNTELDKQYLSKNLMDDDITHRERIKKEFGIIL